MKPIFMDDSVTNNIFKSHISNKLRKCSILLAKNNYKLTHAYSNVGFCSRLLCIDYMLNVYAYNEENEEFVPVTMFSSESVKLGLYLIDWDDYNENYRTIKAPKLESAYRIIRFASLKLLQEKDYPIIVGYCDMSEDAMEVKDETKYKWKWAKDDEEFKSLIDTLKTQNNALIFPDGTRNNQIWFIGKTFKGEYIAFDFNQKTATKIKECLVNYRPRIIIVEIGVYKDILKDTPNFAIGFDGIVKLINSNVEDEQDAINTVMVPEIL